jgi:hypothetical protein
MAGQSEWKLRTFTPEEAMAIVCELFSFQLTPGGDGERANGRCDAPATMRDAVSSRGEGGGAVRLAMQLKW